MSTLYRRGATGAKIQELQAALNFHIRSPAMPLMPDGVFGSNTESRVREFQTLAGIKDDGIVGPVTVSHLYRQMRGTIDVRTQPPIRRTGTIHTRSGLMGLQPTRPAIGKPPASPPQTRTIRSNGFGFDSKIVFDTLAGPGDRALKISISQTLPLAIGTPAPLVLEVERNLGAGLEVEGTLKAPFKVTLPTDRLGLEPYYFTGISLGRMAFQNLSVGAGVNLKLNIVKNIFGSGYAFTIAGDGGVNLVGAFDTGSVVASRFFLLTFNVSKE